MIYLHVFYDFHLWAYLAVDVITLHYTPEITNDNKDSFLFTEIKFILNYCIRNIIKTK